jgi:hypothetical protein
MKPLIKIVQVANVGVPEPMLKQSVYVRVVEQMFGCWSCVGDIVFNALHGNHLIGTGGCVWVRV